MFIILGIYYLLGVGLGLIRNSHLVQHSLSRSLKSHLSVCTFCVLLVWIYTEQIRHNRMTLANVSFWLSLTHHVLASSVVIRIGFFCYTLDWLNDVEAAMHLYILKIPLLFGITTQPECLPLSFISWIYFFIYFPCDLTPLWMLFKNYTE